jgi:hypothetical protein
MKFANATKIHRKSGVAERRDLRFSLVFSPHESACRVVRLLKAVPFVHQINS